MVLASPECASVVDRLADAYHDAVLRVVGATAPSPILTTRASRPVADALQIVPERRPRPAAARECEFPPDAGAGRMCVVASYGINQVGIEHARELIAKRQYVLRSEWGEVQPRAAAENAYVERHGWEKYARWFLGLTDGVGEQTKARYAFVIGDFRRIHRSGIIACHYRAAEWRHKAIELAAHELLQLLDQTAFG
jgi:hypothetical protein